MAEPILPVKVRIKRGSPGQGMQYPPRYNAQEVDSLGLGPGAIGGPLAYSGGLQYGLDHEYCYIGLPASLAAEYAQDVDMEIVDESVAETDMEAWRVERGVPDVTVRNSEMVNYLMLKRIAGDTLTTEEEAVLDPESEVAGVNKVRPSVAATLARVNKARGAARGND